MSLPYRHRPAVESRRGPRPGPIEARALLPPDWKGATYLALDVETTALDAKRCRVIEIGALLFVPDNPLDGGKRIDRLVDPGEPIPAQTTAIHGIRDEDVRGAPSFAEIAPELARLAAGAIIVAHNAPFDMGFLSAEFARVGLPPLANPVLDSLVLARAAFPGLPSYSLPKLAKALGIESERSHRALDDAVVAARVFIDSSRRLCP